MPCSAAARISATEIPASLGVRGPGVDSLPKSDVRRFAAEELSGIWVNIDRPAADIIEALAISEQPTNIKSVAGPKNQAFAGSLNNVRGGVELFFGDDAVLDQPALHRIELDSGYRRFQWTRANLRLQSTCGGAAKSTGVTAFQLQSGLSIDIHEMNTVAGVDKVRVFDLGIDLPQLGPQPRSLQEPTGDVPQGVTLDDRIDVWVVITQILAQIARRFTCN